MASNIAIKVTADVADLTAKRAIMSAELRAGTKDLDAFAKTARASGMTDELRAGMLQAAESVAKARGQIHSLDADLKGLGTRSGAVSALDKVFDSSRLAVLESGSERLRVFGSALEPLGAVGIAAAAGVAAFGFAAEGAKKSMEWAEQLERAANTLGLTTTQLQEFDFVAQSVGIPIDKMRESMSGLEKTIGLVESGLARSMQVKAFTAGLKITPDQLRSWGDLGTQLDHVLDSASKLNVEERAAIASRLKVDPEVLQSLIDAKDDLDGLKEAAHRYGIILSEDTIAKQAAAAREMHKASAIMSGEFRTAFLELAPLLVAMANGLADGSKEVADFVRGVKDGLAPLEHLADVLHRIAGVDLGKTLSEASALISRAGIPGVGAPNLDFFTDTAAGGAAARKRDDQATRGAAPTPAIKPEALSAGKAKGGGASVVSEWTEQLHAMEIASGEFFKDQTEKELAFWQGKLTQTKAGSKDWLEVQAKIFEASKSLAHQDYQDHIADLNARIEADRGSWAKEQADWQEKLAFIRSKFGEEGAEYKNAHREFEAEERRHQDQMLQAQKDGLAKAFEALKAGVEAQRQIREQDTRTQEALIKEHAQGVPIAGEIQAELQIAALHRQLMQQQIADEETLAQAKDAQLQHEIAAEAAANGTEGAAYKKLIDEKLAADAEFAAKHRQLEDQMVNQTIQDQLRVRQAWRGAIDPMVQSFGSGIQGMIAGTESWKQALAGVASTMLGVVVTAIEHMVEQWILNLILGKAQQQTIASTTALSYVGVAGAAGVASMAAAPFPLDLTAPAFGAQMAATAAGYATIASLDTGTDFVPADMLAQIHQGERIIPAADNAALMSAVGAGGGGGDVHHHWNISPSMTVNNNGKTGVELTQDHMRQIIIGIQKAARNRPGGRPF